MIDTRSADASIKIDLELFTEATVSGVVLDSKGTPLDNDVVVFLYDSSGHAVAYATTDTNGRFHVSGLPAGTYNVLASHPNVMFNSVSTFTGHGISNILDIRGASGTLLGHVRNPEGTPVSNGTVAAVSVDASTGVRRATRTQTDSEGRSRLSGIPDGEISVFASAPNWAISRIALIGGIGGVAQTDLTLTAGYRVSGCITDSANGQPIAAGRVLAVNVAFEDGPVRAATTDDNGRYELNQLAAGNYRIVTIADGWAQHFETISVTSDTRSDAVLRVTGHVLRGAIVDSDTGLPVADAFVLLKRTNTLPLTALTDEQGVFTASSLLPGDYSVKIVHSGGTETQQVTVTGDT